MSEPSSSSSSSQHHIIHAFVNRPIQRWAVLVIIVSIAAFIHLASESSVVERIEENDLLVEDVNREKDHVTLMYGDDQVKGVDVSSSTDDETTKLMDHVDSDTNNDVTRNKHISSASNRIRRSSIRAVMGDEIDPWTSPHSTNQTSASASLGNSNIRISFRLNNNNNIQNRFLSVPGYTCPPQIASLPPNLSHRPILNFTTSISTNLKIIFVGDSITQQFAQGFYSAILDEELEGSHAILRSFINGRPVNGIDLFNLGLHVCSSVVAPGRGGGVGAYWRVLHLMNRDGEAEYVNCKNQVGWSRYDSMELLNHEYSTAVGGERNVLEMANSTRDRDSNSITWFRSHIKGNATRPSFKVDHFDAVVIRPPHGWMKLKDITRERVVDAINLCNELVGAQIVIITTLQFNNNIKTPQDWNVTILINEMIRDIAATWQPAKNGGGGVQHVLVQEFGNLTNQILWMNAQNLGYNISMPDFAQHRWEKMGSEFLLHRLDVDSWKFNPSIPMVCADMPRCLVVLETEAELDETSATAKQFDTEIAPKMCAIDTKKGSPQWYDCMRCMLENCLFVDHEYQQRLLYSFFNRFSRDGMHWCVETLGPRYSASIACLLGCVTNGDAYHVSTSKRYDSERIQKCERDCNDQFMSLVPVEESWIDDETTLYSVEG
jgi:hypothetical protein